MVEGVMVVQVMEAVEMVDGVEVVEWLEEVEVVTVVEVVELVEGVEEVEVVHTRPLIHHQKQHLLVHARPVSLQVSHHGDVVHVLRDVRRGHLRCTEELVQLGRPSPRRVLVQPVKFVFHSFLLLLRIG